MANIIHHQIRPDAPQDSYVSDQTATFTIDPFDKQALLQGSIRIEGNIEITDGTNTLTSGDGVYLDRFAGSHTLLADLRVEAANLGMLEYNASYPRTVAAVHRASKSNIQLGSAVHYAGLMGPARDSVQGLITAEGNAQGVELASFSVQPLCCLNRASGPLKLSKTGAIRLSFRFTPSQDCIYGEDAIAANTWTYTVTNLRLRFTTVGAHLAADKVVTRTIQVVRQALESRSPTIQIRAPVVADSFSMFLQPQAVEGSYNQNSLVMQRPGGITQARIYLDSAETQLTNRDLKTGVDVLQGFLSSMQAAGFANAGTVSAMARQEGWGMGTVLSKHIDFSKVNSTVRLSTPAISNTVPWVCYVLYHGVLTI